MNKAAGEVPLLLERFSDPGRISCTRDLSPALGQLRFIQSCDNLRNSSETVEQELLLIGVEYPKRIFQCRLRQHGDRNPIGKRGGKVGCQLPYVAVPL